LVAMSDSLCSGGCFVSCDYVSGVGGSADGLNTGILGAVVAAWCNNMAVEAATDLLAIFHDGCLGAYLNTAVFQDLDTVNDLNFL